MAIDLYSENSPSQSSSPRISFSHDLHNTESSPLMIQHFPSDSDFDFSISLSCIDTEPASSADELFLNGLIRPLCHLQETPAASTHHQPSASRPPLPRRVDESSSKQEKLQPKSPFWGFRRSTSVHCDSHSKKSSFWSFPLLTRSKSTGSVPSSKQLSKDANTSNQNKHSSQYHKQQSKNFMPMSYPSSSSGFYAYPLSQKPSLKKNYGNGVRISPVLNVPPAKGTANLFGLGSLLRNGKEKKRKKK